MEKEKFYITTTLPYVNSSPHIGFASELLRADAVARYHKILGKEIFFNTGTDEHGQKIHDKSVEEGVDTQSYVDRYADEFKKLIPELGILPEVHFVRTTDEHHIRAAQEMWRRCLSNVDEQGRPDIYKAQQVVKYCKGCELEKTDSELEDGKCPLHPTNTIELRDEENYFFRFSRYQKELLELYTANPNFVVPDFRLNEIKKFVEGGLQDFSISRLKSKMPWGVLVPDDEEHSMYVWFDALTNYISTLGWPEKDDFDGFWPGIQVAGKDNLRQQSAIWQAMLLSAKLPTSKQVVVGGFINSGGQKMSKSLGNVISPYELTAKYGTDATRYLLLRHVHPFEDTDITWERLDEWYTANLVNGLGNLVSRVMKMSETHLESGVDIGKLDFDLRHEQNEIFRNEIECFEIQKAMNSIWGEIQSVDFLIQAKEPFKAIKSEDEVISSEAREIMMILVYKIYYIAIQLEPFMPETSRIILEAIQNNKKPENLFPRLP